MNLDLNATLTTGRVFDLSQPYYVGMPHHPNHPPYLFGLVKKHGDYLTPAGTSSASDAIALGSHVGTHIDAFCHFSLAGKLCDGTAAAEVQSYAAGLEKFSVDTIQPILRRGVLLDIAGVEGAGELPVDFAITPALLEKAAGRTPIHAGDVVLLRTGWAKFWNDAARYIAQVHGPGPELDGAKWLSSKGIFAAGSDTVAFEKVPSRDMPVHIHFLVEKRIHIIEALNLEELAEANVKEFLLVAAPMKLKGATGAPIRPLAIVPNN